MNNLNSILIEGYLTREPKLRHTPKGTAVCVMTLVSNRYFKKDDVGGFDKEESFFDIETWARNAEACYSKGKKGRGVRCVGRLKQERWTDSEGKNRSRIVIVADHVEFKQEYAKTEVAPEDAEQYESNPEDYTNEQPVEEKELVEA